MGKAHWVKYKDKGGPRVRGTMVYDPPQPWDSWMKIMGVVARCEGKHDTVVMYDETGVTWGFMQWTFTSGRLQKLLESFKSIPYYDYGDNLDKDSHTTLFDQVCCDPDGDQIFRSYGFLIKHGKFWDIMGGRFLRPNKPAQKQRIRDICMGRTTHPGNLKKQKRFALSLANLFASIGQDFGVAEAQIHFAESEFKRQLEYSRKPLDGKSIKWLLDTCGPVNALYSSMLAALFFNLWQNSPAGAYRLFKNAKKVAGEDAETYFNNAWHRVCFSKYADWGFRSKQYLASNGKNPPRVPRIKKAFKEFYGVDLKLEKP